MGAQAPAPQRLAAPSSNSQTRGGPRLRRASSRSRCRCDLSTQVDGARALARAFADRAQVAP
eukprot:8759942-Alexandrium_andersonii.AAC.1